MSGRALVSGCDERVGQVATALRAAGVEVILVDDPSRLREVAAGLAPESLECYVQMPMSIEVSGATVVGRVRTFLQNGLLARFDATDAVLPALRPDATVVLVSGNSAVDGGGALPDDSAARWAMLQVLAHAARAEKAPAVLRVRILAADVSPGSVAAVAVDGDERPPAPMAQVQAREDEMSYADWRAEVMGLATVEV